MWGSLSNFAKELINQAEIEEEDEEEYEEDYHENEDDFFSKPFPTSNNPPPVNNNFPNNTIPMNNNMINNNIPQNVTLQKSSSFGSFSNINNNVMTSNQQPPLHHQQYNTSTSLSSSPIDMIRYSPSPINNVQNYSSGKTSPINNNQIIMPTNQQSFNPPNQLNNQQQQLNQSNNNYIHIKLFIGDEVNQQEQFIQYLQNQILFLQNELRNQSIKYDKDKLDLNNKLEQYNRINKEQLQKLNELNEINKKLEIELNQTKREFKKEISELESNLSNLSIQKRELQTYLNEQQLNYQQLNNVYIQESSKLEMTLKEMQKLQLELNEKSKVEKLNGNLLLERENELVNLESALEQIQIDSEREISDLTRSLKTSERKVESLNSENEILKEQLKDKENLEKEVQSLRELLKEQQKVNNNIKEIGNNQNEMLVRMLEDCLGRINDENLVDRRVVSKILLSLLTNSDKEQQESIFQFFVKILNIHSPEDEQILHNALIFIQQERFKQLLVTKKSFSELFVNYLLEESKPNHQK
ncbi:hypothetical protein ABK040_006803 [Willaertia magna]